MTLVVRGMRKWKLVSDVGYKPASEIKASGGSQPRNKEGASHLARRGKNAEAFLMTRLRVLRAVCEVPHGTFRTAHVRILTECFRLTGNFFEISC